VETNVAQSAGSKASLADVGLMVVLLREVKLAMFLEARAGVALTQDLEGRPTLIGYVYLFTASCSFFSSIYPVRAEAEAAAATSVDAFRQF
jgi:hypothetical protein